MLLKHWTSFAGLTLSSMIVTMPAAAQVDLDMSYTQSATDAARNGMLSKNTARVARNYRGGAGGVSSGSRSKQEARATCANGRRMQAAGDDKPGLRRLAQMCAQAGL